MIGSGDVRFCSRSSAVGDANIRFSVAVTGAPATYPPRTENQLLRIGREAITNAVRHAGAARIRVEHNRPATEDKVDSLIRVPGVRP